MKTQFNILAPIRLSSFGRDDYSRATASHNLAGIDIQPDLLYMDSVLVSTGENKNTDVFLSAEMWKARNTPVLKPVNWEHNSGKEIVENIDTDYTSSKSIIQDSQIIGGMYNSFAALKDGTPITEEMMTSADFVLPQDFDIINQAVIYKYLYPRAAARIVREAEAGQLFVSMEAWFGGYDYKVGNKIVARNEETAFLDKYLRAKGGTGMFGQATVSRVLRNIVFGGVGIVARPANQDSVIHSFTNATTDDVAIDNEVVASHIIGDIVDVKASNKTQEVIEIMSDKTNETQNSAAFSSDDYKAVVERMVKAENEVEKKDAAIASAQAELDKLTASVDALKSAFADGAKVVAEVLGAETKDKLQSATASDFFSVLASAVDERLQASSALAQALSEANAQIASLAAEKRTIVRAAQIEQVLADYIADASALAARKDKMIASMKDMSDEAFAFALEDTKELLTLAAMPDFLKKKKDDKSEDEDKEDKKDAKASDEGITDPVILDGVKAEASVHAGGDSSSSGADSVDHWKALANDLLGVSKNN